LVTVDSDDGATQWTLSKASGTLIADYVNMNRSNATGGASFYLGANSTATGSTGWVIDNTAPTNPTTFNGWSTSGKTTSITSGNFYNYPNPHFEWDGATDTQSGVAGYYVYFGTDETANPVIAGSWQTEVTYTSSTSLSSGSTYYFRIRTKDNTGNISSAQSMFTYGFDTTAPSPPSFVAASPSGYTSTNSFSFSWPAASDTGGSGVAGYQYKRGNGVDSWSATQTQRTASSIESYQSGVNIFLVRTIDNAANASATVQTNYYYYASAPSKPTSLTAHPSLSDENSFYFTWTAPVHPLDIVDYGYSVNDYPSISNLTWTGNNSTTLPADSYAVSQGTNTLYLVARDESGAYAFDPANVASTTFQCTTPAPPAPVAISISDSSNRSASIWSLTLTWDAGGGQNPATFDHYLVERSVNGVDFSSIATTSSSAYIDASGLNNTTEYTYRVRAVDNAGSQSSPSQTVSDTPTGLYDTPPTITSAPESTTGAATASIVWQTSRAASSFLRYGTAPDNLSVSRGQFDSVISHTINIAGLSSETTYYFQVQSLDEYRDYAADNAWSAIYSFETKAKPYISDVLVSNITLTTADISFKTSTVTQSTISYGGDLNYCSSQVDVSSAGTINHIVKLTNLTHSTTYHFKVEGLDTDGNSLSSDDYVFSTRALPVISDIESAIDNSGPKPGMKVTWKTNVPTTSSINYWPKDGTQTNEESRSQFVTDHEIIVVNLNDNTEYRYYLYGRDEIGNEARSSEDILKSQDDTRPPMISDLVIESSNQGTGDSSYSQLIISWKTDELASSQVEYGEGSSSDSYTNKTQEDATLQNTHMIIIGNLDPSRVYHLRAVSKDKAGNFGYSLDNAYITKKKTESIFDIIIDTLTRAFSWLKFLNK
jgi:hypothetical protein